MWGSWVFDDGEVTNRIYSLVGYFHYKIKMPKGVH